MITGTVKFVCPDGSWGFIWRDDKQPKVFVHMSDVRTAGLDEISNGQRWSFNCAKTSKAGPLRVI